MTHPSMMLFGDKSTFAIETMIEPDLTPPSAPWGRMRIWCQGVSLGNIDDQYCGLDHAFAKLAELARDLDTLWRDEFSTMREPALLDYLDECLFGTQGEHDLPYDRSPEEVRADWERYGAFSFLTNWGEQFDRCGKPYIVCPPGEEVRIISREFPPEGRHSVATSKTAFCDSVIAASVWFAQQRAALNNEI
jgi:hypothetical protein